MNINTQQQHYKTTTKAKLSPQNWRCPSNEQQKDRQEGQMHLQQQNGQQQQDWQKPFRQQYQQDANYSKPFNKQQHRFVNNLDGLKPLSQPQQFNGSYRKPQIINSKPLPRVFENSNYKSGFLEQKKQITTKEYSIPVQEYNNEFPSLKNETKTEIEPKVVVVKTTENFVDSKTRTKTTSFSQIVAGTTTTKEEQQQQQELNSTNSSLSLLSNDEKFVNNNKLTASINSDSNISNFNNNNKLVFKRSYAQTLKN